MPLMPEKPRTSFALLRNPLLWLAIGLVLRLAYLMEQQAVSPLFYQPLLDEQEMADTARRLLAGFGFGHEPLFKAPLYPLYLAGVIWVSGAGYFFLARLVQHLLGGLLILMAWDTARRCAPGERGRAAGAFAAAALALYGPLIRLEDLLILDFFTVFLQSAMLWALVRMTMARRPDREFRWAALAGLAAAASWLNRPTLTPLLPFIALWIAVLRNGLRGRNRRGGLYGRLSCAVMFLAFPLLAMLTVYQRNASIGGEAMLLPWQGGYNFYHANGARANGRYYLQEDYSLARTGNPTRELAEAGYKQAVVRGDTAMDHDQYFHAIDRYWMSLAAKEIKTAPARWAGLMGKKLLYLASAREIFNIEVYDVQRRLSWVLCGLPLSFGVLWPLALASLAVVALTPTARRRRVLSLMWLYLIVLGGAIALYYVSGRLRMPLIFPAAILGGSSIAGIIGPMRPMRPLRLIIFLLLLAGGFAMSWGDWWGVRSENLDHLEYARLSNATWKSGEYANALNYAEACERARPGHPTAAMLRGQALYSLGRISDAATAFEESTRRLPGDPIAPFNLGIIAYYDRPDPRRAAAMFDEALRRQKDYDSAAFMATLAHLRLGEKDRARALLGPWLAHIDQKSPLRLLIAATAFYRLDNKPEAAIATTKLIEQTAGAEGMKRLAGELKILGSQ